MRLKFVVSGPGLIGRKHIELVASHPDCSLAAVVTPHPQSSQEFLDSLEVPVFADLESARSAVDPDAAIISAPNEFHLQQGKYCIENAIPVLVEKPVTSTLAEAKELAAFARSHDTPCMVGHHRTHSPLLRTAKEFLESPSFGDLVAVFGSALYLKPESYFAAGPWRREAGGGPILINLIHDVGILTELCGDIVEVAAMDSNSRRGFVVEDTAAICMRFSSGALGTFVVSDAAASSKSWEMTSGENPSFPNYPAEDCYHFSGTRGSMDFPTLTTRTYGTDQEGSWLNRFETGRCPVTRADPLLAQLDHFVEVIRGRAQPLVPIEKGRQYMLAVEAIRRSISTGRTVRLDDIG